MAAGGQHLGVAPPVASRSLACLEPRQESLHCGGVGLVQRLCLKEVQEPLDVGPEGAAAARAALLKEEQERGEAVGDSELPGVTWHPAVIFQHSGQADTKIFGFLRHSARPIESIMGGTLDARKLQSSLTLMMAAGAGNTVQMALDTFFDGKACARTNDILDQG